MALSRALVCVGLLFLAFAAAGAAEIQNEANDEQREVAAGRNLLGWYWLDNSGNVWGKQTQVQSVGNAIGNNGPVNQQVANVGAQANGNFNGISVSNGNFFQAGPEPPKPAGPGGPGPAGPGGPGPAGPGGRKLLGQWVYYDVDNSFNVKGKQTQIQGVGNTAWNQGPVNQQVANVGAQANGNFNAIGINNGNSFQAGPEPPKPAGPGGPGPAGPGGPGPAGPGGRKLLTDGWVWYGTIDNSFNVKGKQTQIQGVGNAIGNKGPIDQQVANVGAQANGNFNAIGINNGNSIQTGPVPPKPAGPGPAGPGGRKLLTHGGGWFWVDNSGNVWGKQTQVQVVGNTAINSGPVNQQVANVGAQANGNFNSIGINNLQSIKTGP